MLRRTATALVVVGMLVASLPAFAKRAKKPDAVPKTESAAKAEPAAKVEPVDVTELLRQANELASLKRDYNGALAKFNQAVEAAPKDAAVRLQRAEFFEVVSGIVVPEEKEKFQNLAREDYKFIADDDPDSIRAGVARDGLTRLSGNELLKRESVTCSKETLSAHARAEALFDAGRYAEAAAEYETAAAGCPASADIWVHYADAFFMMGQYEKAKELFTKALSADPWIRSGHRFLADTEAKLRNGAAVIHELELAVISDPLYEAGWSALRTYATGMGRKWNRVFGTKTDVSREPDADGKKNVTITLPAAATADTEDPDAGAWAGYGLVKASVLSGKVFDTDDSGAVVERDVDPDAMSALEIERESVKSAIRIARELDAAEGAKPARFWSMMARAEKAGYLDEAIFLHLFDAPLAAEYPAFREKNVEKLVSYLDTVIVP